MKNIHYTGETMMTGDDIADAVVQYAETLAVHETSASIGIPVVTADGRTVEASFLLGPASQIVAVPADSDYADPVDVGLLQRIRLERAKLDGIAVRPAHRGDDSQFDFDY